MGLETEKAEEKEKMVYNVIKKEMPDELIEVIAQRSLSEIKEWDTGSDPCVPLLQWQRKKGYMLFYIISIIVILVDQITKNLVRIYIDMNERFTWLGIEFTHIENSGMAGGLFPGYARVFGVIAVLFVIFVFYLRRAEEWRGLLKDCSLGFLVGGAIGNGIDRLLFGQVTDFIARSGGVLNIADHALEIGMALLILSELVRWLKSKKWIFK